MSAEKTVATMGYSTSDKLAFERTRLAHERTLIAFGFGMYKLFEFIPFVTGMKPGEHVVSPRVFALFLASLGNVCLLLAAIQHRMSLQAMRALGLKVPRSAAAILALLLSLLGIGVLVIVILRL